MSINNITNSDNYFMIIISDNYFMSYDNYFYKGYGQKIGNWKDPCVNFVQYPETGVS